MGVDGEIWQGIAANSLKDAARILAYYFDVAAEQYPVAWQRLVAVAERVPAMMSGRVLADRDNAE